MAGRAPELSEREEQLIRLLPKNGSKVTTEELAQRMWPNNRGPLYARTTIYGLIRNIQMKARYSRAIPRIVRGPRRGPRPIEVWIKT